MARRRAHGAQASAWRAGERMARRRAQGARALGRDMRARSAATRPTGTHDTTVCALTIRPWRPATRAGQGAQGRARGAATRRLRLRYGRGPRPGHGKACPQYGRACARLGVPVRTWACLLGLLGACASGLVFNLVFRLGIFPESPNEHCSL